MDRPTDAEVQLGHILTEFVLTGGTFTTALGTAAAADLLKAGTVGEAFDKAIHALTAAVAVLEEVRRTVVAVGMSTAPWPLPRSVSILRRQFASAPRAGGGTEAR